MGKSRLDNVLGVLVLVGVIVALYMAFLEAPRERTMGDLQRIFYFHVPAGMVGLLALAVNFVASVMYLVKKNRWWDSLAFSAAEIGVMFMTIVLVTGPIWAKPVWLVWWTWSPRLTSSLLLWMLYVAYLLIRNYVPDPDRRAATSAVFGIVAFIDAPIVWFSIRWWRDLHPSPMIESGGLAPEMRPALWTCAAAFLLLFIYLLRRRLFVETARQDVEMLSRRIEMLR
ncbi:MAG: ABC-type transport system involved in cytochrome c biosis, permease component [Acidobacteria bacterium]|nr:ABC-type transport system involved in cytochrome c biosis, permease component [Acidobacteriota bacterium]